MKKYNVDLNLDLMQNIRLAQALLEISDGFSFHPKYRHIFDYLSRTLDTNYLCSYSNKDESELNVEFNHSKPSITVAGKEYILVFPKIIESHLKSKWVAKRYKTTFNGILTLKRYRFIHRIIKSRGGKFKEIEFILKFGILLKLPKIILDLVTYNLSIQVDNLNVTFTNKGRKFPEKAWDNKYFETLLESKYVLCPDGDFIWTYRFFESIICGAIPVIENTCSAYYGFNFLSVDQYLNNQILTREQIESNFQFLIDNFTLNSLDLLQAIEKN